MGAVKFGPRRVTPEDFRAVDDILDEVWDNGKPLPRWAAARLKTIIVKGLPPKDRSER
jgi:hypothetical protein